MDWWADGLMDWWTGGLMDWWADGLMDWWADGLMDWWADGLMGCYCESAAVKFIGSLVKCTENFIRYLVYIYQFCDNFGLGNSKRWRIVW